MPDKDKIFSASLVLDFWHDDVQVQTEELKKP